jgi:hypothetical protein
VHCEKHFPEIGQLNMTPEKGLRSALRLAFALLSEIGINRCATDR